jgi:hypothetical protein
MSKIVNKHNDIWEWNNVLENPDDVYELLKNNHWSEYTNKLPKDDPTFNEYKGETLIGKTAMMFPGDTAHKLVLDSFSTCFEDYVKDKNLKLTKNNIGQSWLMLREYYPGSALAAHSDGYGYVTKDGTKVKPVFTIILYLNDDYVGGEVDFINDDFIFKPKAGSAIMFPSDKWHQVLEVKSGIRRMVQTYVYEHERDYYDPDAK